MSGQRAPIPEEIVRNLQNGCEKLYEDMPPLIRDKIQSLCLTINEGGGKYVVDAEMVLQISNDWMDCYRFSSKKNFSFPDGIEYKSLTEGLVPLLFFDCIKTKIYSALACYFETIDTKRYCSKR